MRGVAVTVVGGGIPSGEAMNADVVSTVGSDDIGSEDGQAASTTATEPDDSFRCGDNSSQNRSKRRRISPPSSQQKEAAIMTTSDKAILLAHATRYKKEALEKRISNGKKRALEKRKMAAGKAAVESPWLQWQRASSDEDSFSLADSSSYEEMDYDDSDAALCVALLAGAVDAIPSSIPVVSTDEEMGDTDSDAATSGDSITGSTADLDDGGAGGDDDVDDTSLSEDLSENVEGAGDALDDGWNCGRRTMRNSKSDARCNTCRMFRSDRRGGGTAAMATATSTTSSADLSIGDVDHLLIDRLKAALAERNLATYGDIHAMRNRLRRFIERQDGGAD